MNDLIRRRALGAENPSEPKPLRDERKIASFIRIRSEVHAR